MLSGHLISSELIDKASLVGLYGGGYEIAYIDSVCKFAKCLSHKWVYAALR